MMKIYDPKNWYWIVGGDTQQVYASKASDYVLVADADFTAWQKDGTMPTEIDTAFSLGGVLAPYWLKPIPPDVLEGYEAALAANRAVAVDYDHEKRLCELEGVPPPDISALGGNRG